MPDKHGGATPEQYEEPVAPTSPPQATAGPATVVAGMWYYLAPIVLIAAVILMAIFYWGDRDDASDDAVEPTTGISDETTPAEAIRLRSRTARRTRASPGEDGSRC